MNNKTVHRAFTVLLCLITVFVMIMAVTPLSFALALTGSSNRVAMKNDTKHSYLANYFFGLNSGMIDAKCSAGTWRRFVFDNTAVTVNVYNSNGIGYIMFNPNAEDNDTVMLYYYDIGSNYTNFGSYNWNSMTLSQSTDWQLNSVAPNIYWFNCGIENGFRGTQTISGTSACYPNAYYPIIETATVNVNVIVDNQESIASSQENNASSRYSAQQSEENSRYSAQQSEANSRQSQIMNEGSDITVSTIDNWVGGQNGLANKLTQFAQTLSVNAYRFSENQQQVSSQLVNAGNMMLGAFNKFPTILVACMFCFMIILICVKVVGR